MKKIIYAVIIIIIISISIKGFIVYTRLHWYQPFVFYVDEKNKDSSYGHFIIKDFTFFCFDYLKDDRSLADYISAYESLIGYLQTCILISTDEKFPYKISLVDCHVEIKDEHLRVIPFKNIQVVNDSFHSERIIQYSNEKELIKSKSFLYGTKGSFYIYYTYSHKDFEKVEKATIEVYLKLSANGKTYEKRVIQKIKRQTKMRYIMSRRNIPKEFY